MYAASTFSALVSMNGPNKDTFRRKVSDVRKDTRDSKRHDALTMPNIVMCVCVCVCVRMCQETAQTTRQACLRLVP